MTYFVLVCDRLFRSNVHSEIGIEDDKSWWNERTKTEKKLTVTAAVGLGAAALLLIGFIGYLIGK